MRARLLRRARSPGPTTRWSRILLDEMAEAGGAETGERDRPHGAAAGAVGGARQRRGRATRSITTTSTWRCRAIPSVAILPGLLALAEERRARGRDVIAAFVAGYETACRIGMAMRPGHYGRGFHATGTVGAFGAAAACARLLGLDAEATGRALGIAGTQAAGLKSQFGTMCKPFHAGKAAQNGLLGGPSRGARVFQPPRPRRMRPGLRADPQPRFQPRGGARRAAERLSHPRQSLQVPRRLLHDARADRMRPPVARAAGQARRDRRDRPCRCNRGSTRICNIQAPTDGLEAKFSLRQTVAMALSGVDTASLGAYSVATATDPALVAAARAGRVRFPRRLPGSRRRAGGDAARRPDVLRASHDAGIADDRHRRPGRPPRRQVRRAGRAGARRRPRPRIARR